MNPDVSASVCCSCEAVRMSVEKGVVKTCLRDRRGRRTTVIVPTRAVPGQPVPDNLSVKTLPLGRITAR
ncbi:hypothetical protein SLA_1854 [Streptomyces laurentii]|uniref:Uncharacterized protein n=1 Tax=Streptomyces laurentii TaxID=39478 RepID=A0A169NAW7_STRLU|nr:hypothetical protein SLA_1854 [Streptomyces laurentii]